MKALIIISIVLAVAIFCFKDKLKKAIDDGAKTADGAIDEANAKENDLLSTSKQIVKDTVANLRDGKGVSVADIQGKLESALKGTSAAPSGSAPAADQVNTVSKAIQEALNKVSTPIIQATKPPPTNGGFIPHTPAIPVKQVNASPIQPVFKRPVFDAMASGINFSLGLSNKLKILTAEI